MKDYYQILELSPDASSDEVKSSYRKLARLYHPDYNDSESAHYMFQEIHEAYSALSDKESREEYDRLSGRRTSERLKTYYQAQQAAEENSNNSAKEQERLKPKKPSQGKQATKARQNDDLQAKLFRKLREREKQESSLDDSSLSAGNKLLRSLKEGATRYLRSSKERPLSAPSFKRSSRRPVGDARKSSVEDKLKGEREYLFTITAKESVTGTSRELALRDEGRGPRLLRVKVPPAVNDQAVLRIAIDEKSDAKVRIRIVNDDLLERRGLDLTLKLPITIGEAISGAEIEVPTPLGPTTVRLPPQDNSKKRLRLKGRGVTDPKTGVTGDLYVRPFIVPPETRSATAEHAAKALDEHYTTPVRLKLPKKF